MERWRIRKVVFAHMVYAGRGNQPADDLTHEEKRRALDMILDRAEDFSRCDIKINIATDDNHTDGIYYYLRLASKNPRRAATAFRLLRASGAEVQGAGTGVAGIDSVGNVQPDPYWSDHLLGNVRHIPFSEIWRKSADPLLQGLRNRLPLADGAMRQLSLESNLRRKFARARRAILRRPVDVGPRVLFNESRN